jgi:methylglyoxal synthase
MKFGLIANKLHRKHGASGLFQWLNAAEAEAIKLQLEFNAIGGTYDAIVDRGYFKDYAKLTRSPNGFEGGLMRMVSHIAGGVHEGDELDGIIYLLDPVDPSSTFPEARALRRQCVIHAKPFVATVAGAIEWIAIEAVHAGLRRPLQIQAEHTLALIAHDALKDRMVQFASDNFDLLSRFAHRVATGTTGGLLNDLAWSKGWSLETPWVQRYRSGPLGGDAQIAELVLEKRCHKAIFFEDPHVARQHEADIHLLERAVASVSEGTICFNSPMMAERWAKALTPDVTNSEN